MLDHAVLVSDTDTSRLEAILGIVSNGSFPPPGGRENLSNGQRRQLRDAMILEAHARESRDIFVTEDRKGFIANGKRGRLENLCRTRICTLDELEAGLGAP